jgi:hypothetical protein
MDEEMAQSKVVDCDGITCVGLERLRGEVNEGFAQNNAAIEAAAIAATSAAEGVANFRRFQLDVTKKIGFVHGAVWIGGVVGSIVVAVTLAVLGWALSWIVPAAKVVVGEYYRNHPAAIYDQHSQSEPQPDTASNTEAKGMVMQ